MGLHGKPQAWGGPMGKAQAPARLIGPPRGDREPLVGAAVEVTGGVGSGPYGVQETCKAGQPSSFAAGVSLMDRYQICGRLCVLLQWPASTIVFVVTLLAQNCAPCCFCLWGKRWFMDPSQISYIHALYVIQHTLKDSWWGTICCCVGWWVQLQPGILFATQMLETPPKFLFDEDKDAPFLMTFDDYVEKKRETFPPFSGRYRAIDGGGNWHEYPFLGQSGRGYAANEPYMVLDPSVLPDPDEMSKALNLRTTFKESPFGQNAIASWFANVAIHDFFRTATGVDAKYTGGVSKPWVNLHSGYLDLQVLYGFNQEMADSARAFKNGHLKKVAETRFEHIDGKTVKLPETKAIVTMLMREHNYVCDQLKLRYPYQFTTDEELYQQARLIMGGVFINVILRQYGDQMFGENAPDARGFAELRQSWYGCWSAIGGRSCCAGKRTVGNQSTFTFNLIYRWHTSIPDEWDASNPPPDQTDDDLRNIFLSAYRQKGGGYGPHNMPEGLFPRHISVPGMAIRAGRRMGCPRLNDFRRRFTKPYTSFEDMCGDPVVAAELAKWYPTIEDVELAVGCQVERCMFGGWCLGETTGVAILADAFNAIRQDRFYTEDFTPEHYTDWGFQHAKTTTLVDILNRHLDMGLEPEVSLGRVPEYKGPPSWSDMAGWPRSKKSFDARGKPKMQEP